MAAASILRVLVDCGHGLGNVTAFPLTHDPGAFGCGITEYELASTICDQAVDRFYFARDETNSPTTAVTVIPTPSCSESCASRHKKKYDRLNDRTIPVSHLSYKIDWINENSAPFDYVLSVHLNSAPNPDASGTEVYYAATAPVARLHEADNISRIVSAKLGLPNRGARVDTETYRKKNALLRKTTPPALLLELGFITNQRDVDAIKACGVEAIIAAIEGLAGKR